MAIRKLMARFRRLRNRRGESQPANRTESAAHLLRGLQLTQLEELDCGQVYELIEAAAEAQLRGKSVEQLMPLIALHLKICPDCLEEYQALLSVLRSTGSP
jgi:hypothetical protein